MSAQPSIGRIVHYHSYGTPNGEYKSEPRAAIITQVHEGSADHEGVDQVGLCVLNPTGQFFNQYVAYSEEPLPGCWSWPTRA